MKVVDIPEAVAMDILSRLPVKSLLRFRCVCKPWSASFRTSHFITKHYRNNNNNLNILLKRNRVCSTRHLLVRYFSALSTEKGQNFKVRENIDLPFLEDFHHFTDICGPCNGLLCLHYYSGKAAIWNPSTRESKMIPKSTVPRPPAVHHTLFGHIGFGYDSATDDYKIVRFLHHCFLGSNNRIDQVELYSLKSDSWKEISLPVSSSFVNTMFNQYINGFYYWQTGKRSEKLILSFDMVNEKFSTLPLPDSDVFSAQYEDKLCKLLNFNGLLGAIIYEWEGAEKSLNLWVMNGTWTRQFSIESIPGVERPLGFWKDGGIFLESLNNELVFFDPATKEVKNLGVDAYKFEMKLFVYVESLVPINGRSEHEDHIIRQPAEEASNRHRNHIIRQPAEEASNRRRNHIIRQPAEEASNRHRKQRRKRRD